MSSLSKRVELTILESRYLNSKAMRLAFVLSAGILIFLLVSCATGSVGENWDIRRAIFILSDANNDKLQVPTRRQYQASKLLFDDTDPFAHRGIYLNLLKHRNWWLRYWAASTIRSHAPHHNEEISTDDPFRKALLVMAQNDPVLDVRAEAIYALNDLLVDVSDCEWLVRLYTSEPAGNPIIKDSSTAPYEYKRALADALSKCPGTEKLLAPKDMDIPTIMKILGSADPNAFFHERTDEQVEADDALDRKDPTAIFDELLPYLNHPNPVVRNRVIQVLGDSKRPEAYPLLVNKLHNDPLTIIRYITISALVNLGDRRACAEFSKLLNESSFGIESPQFPTMNNIHNEAQMAMKDLGCPH